jgi:hypothetical protein
MWLTEYLQEGQYELGYQNPMLPSGSEPGAELFSTVTYSFAILAKDHSVVANDDKVGNLASDGHFGPRKKGIGSQIGHDLENPGKTWATTNISRTRFLYPKTAIFPNRSTKSLQNIRKFPALNPERSRSDLPEAVRGHTCPQTTEPYTPSFIDCGDFPSIDKFSCRPHGETASEENIFLSPAAGEFTCVNFFFL